MVQFIICSFRYTMFSPSSHFLTFFPLYAWCSRLYFCLSILSFCILFFIGLATVFFFTVITFFFFFTFYMTFLVMSILCSKYPPFASIIIFNLCGTSLNKLWMISSSTWRRMYQVEIISSI